MEMETTANSGWKLVEQLVWLQKREAAKIVEKLNSGSLYILFVMVAS